MSSFRFVKTTLRNPCFKDLLHKLSLGGSALCRAIHGQSEKHERIDNTPYCIFFHERSFAKKNLESP
jgi:hypothetical protein